MWCECTQNALMAFFWQLLVCIMWLHYDAATNGDPHPNGRSIYSSAEVWIGIGYPMVGTLASHIKHVELFESIDINKSHYDGDLYYFLMVPELYACINETKTQELHSTIWLDYLASLEGLMRPDFYVMLLLVSHHMVIS